METELSHVDIYFDENDKLLLRDLLAKNSRTSNTLGFDNTLESIQVGMSGELAVFKWLKSQGLNVALQTIENSQAMESDIHINSKNGTQIRLEIKTSSRDLYPLIPYEQVNRITKNSDFVIFCNIISEKLGIRITNYIRTAELSKLRECKIITEEGNLIHFLKIEDHNVISIVDFLTEIKAWKLISN
jgi:Holliday junction resolvase-like predicted endonuclease